MITRPPFHLPKKQNSALETSLFGHTHPQVLNRQLKAIHSDPLEKYSATDPLATSPTGAPAVVMAPVVAIPSKPILPCCTVTPFLQRHARFFVGASPAPRSCDERRELDVTRQKNVVFPHEWEIFTWIGLRN